MNIVTIPKKIAGRDDLIVLPRREYESLLRARGAKEFKPTKAQVHALALAERNFRKGKTLLFNELVRKLVSPR